MTSEYDLPQSVIHVIRTELETTKRAEVVFTGLDLLSRYIDSIHSFSHDLANGKLKGKFTGARLCGSTSIPNTDHFLGQYPEFNRVYHELDRFVNEHTKH